MNDMYVLAEDGETPVPATPAQWGAYRRKHFRVAVDEIGSVRVSTVWLGLDHGWGNGPPVLWETMIFGGGFDQDCERYTSLADAKRGHAETVERVRAAQAAEGRGDAE